MSKIEQIKQQYGKRDPFRVPDGYFEDLTSKVMSQIPENEIVLSVKNSSTRKWTWISVAAMICVLLVSSLMVSYYFTSSSSVMESNMANENLYLEGEKTYIEEMVDYALISDAMIYYEYLAEGEE